MLKAFVRHAAEKPDHPQADSPEGAPILESGIPNAAEVGADLVSRDLNVGYIAVSTKLRSQQTAAALGSRIQHIYPHLDEIALTKEMKVAMRDENHVPPEAIEAARTIMTNLPEEDVIVGHGGWLAGVRYLYQDQIKVERFLPVHLEVTLLEL
jgi:phosphohistidine phosphatase SixA